MRKKSEWEKMLWFKDGCKNSGKQYGAEPYDSRLLYKTVSEL